MSLHHCYFVKHVSTSISSFSLNDVENDANILLPVSDMRLVEFLEKNHLLKNAFRGAEWDGTVAVWELTEGGGGGGRGGDWIKF